jgi:hypothetical protein
MRWFAVYIMNKTAGVYDVRFADPTPAGYGPLLQKIAVDNVQLNKPVRAL